MLGETLGPWTLTHHFLLLKALLKKNLCMTETTWTLFSKKKDNLGLVKRTIKETHSNRLKALF
jgi:hypothetical protein